MLKSPGPTRILVVEDEAIIAEGLRLRLTQLGFEVSGVAASGEDAIRLADETGPDLVLMDIRLGGAIDGIAAGRHIRATADVPIVYLTANTDRPTVQKAMETSPFGYLSKPIRDETLQTTIAVALHKNQVEREYKQREQRFISTLASLGDALIVVDEVGRVTFLNPAAADLTGWTNAEAVGRNIGDILLLEDVAGSPLVPTDTALAGGEPVTFTMAVLIRRDGVSIIVTGASVPVASGSVRGVVVSLRRPGTVPPPAPPKAPGNRKIIPTCASCRDIRDADGQWLRLETFFEREYPIQFSHGICLTCARRLYPGIRHFQEE